MSEPYKLRFDVKSGDFARAGGASRSIKAAMIQLGIENKIVRKIAIATYEAEMNLAIHSEGGYIEVLASPDKLQIVIEDVGPGIKDVNLAMTEGYSTASDKVREMGFGAGMGLPNMKLCADNFDIQSTYGIGTKITMVFKI